MDSNSAFSPHCTHPGSRDLFALCSSFLRVYIVSLDATRYLSNSSNSHVSDLAWFQICLAQKGCQTNVSQICSQVQSDSLWSFRTSFFISKYFSSLYDIPLNFNAFVTCIFSVPLTVLVIAQARYFSLRDLASWSCCSIIELHPACWSTQQCS